MITRLHLKNFKSFNDEGHEIPLGSLSLLVGTNASGKSNIRDALRFLHGLARGYTLAEIFGEKYGEGGVLQWKGIRGGFREAIHGVKQGTFTIGCEVRHINFIRINDGKLRIRRTWPLRYTVEIEVGQNLASGKIVNEELLAWGKTIFSTYPATLRSSQANDGKQIVVRISKQGSKKYIGPTMKLSAGQPIVSQLSDHPDATGTTRTACRVLMEGLASMRFLDLDPQALRRPSLPGQDVLGDKGENLSSVLQTLCEDKGSAESLVEWIRELTPLDVDSIEFEKVSADGKIQLALKESNGCLITAESASDGTLRFLAFAAALLGTKPAATYVFEEIENGIHPNRAHLLLALLQHATKEENPTKLRAGTQIVFKKTTQVIATTHSPALLNFLRGKALDDALLVTRIGGSSKVDCMKNLPIIKNDRSSVGDLLESGWFENVAAFLTEGEDEGS